MEAKLPIYGLACPNTKKTNCNCGCQKQNMMKNIKGVVINEVTKKPFSKGLVNVYNTTTKKGALPNDKGEFVLKASLNDIIQISFVGFETVRLPASKFPAIIELKEQRQQLQEVVITPVVKKDNNWVIWLGIAGFVVMYATAEDQ